MYIQKRQFLTGFTLIELVIAVGIIGLMGAIGLVSFVNSRHVRNLSNSGQEIISVLRLAQTKTLAGENNSSWGVKLETSRYILFRGGSYAGASWTEIFNLPGNIEIANISLAGGSQEIVFNRLDGRTNQTGSFDLRVSGTGGAVFSVSVDNSGKIYQTGSVPAPAGSRVLDTRHRTFNLAGTIKNSVTLTLTFSDPPNPNTVYPVVMTPAPPRTSFDWSGSVTVGGQSQTLRVHTLSITDSATSLSVDRDCRKNTKQVKISFDTSDVATYSADCQNITVWPFGGSVSEP